MLKGLNIISYQLKTTVSPRYLWIERGTICAGWSTRMKGMKSIVESRIRSRSSPIVYCHSIYFLVCHWRYSRHCQGVKGEVRGEVRLTSQEWIEDEVTESFTWIIVERKKGREEKGKEKESTLYPLPISYLSRPTIQLDWIISLFWNEERQLNTFTARDRRRSIERDEEIDDERWIWDERSKIKDQRWRRSKIEKGRMRG